MRLRRCLGRGDELRYELHSLFGRPTLYVTYILYHIHQLCTQPSSPPMPRCSTPTTTSNDQFRRPPSTTNSSNHLWRLPPTAKSGNHFQRPNSATTFDGQLWQPPLAANSNNTQPPLLTVNSGNLRWWPLHNSNNHYFNNDYYKFGIC